MFYSAELLSLRKKGKLAYCWLAGTLTDRMFRKAVNTKTILSINIPATCDEILRYNTNDPNTYSRFSVCLNAKLMHGCAKIYSIQVTAFHDYLLRIKIELNPVIDLAPANTKKTDEINISTDMLIEPPPLSFGPLDKRDKHLLPEADFDMFGYGLLQGDDYMAALDFGPLTNEELDLIFNDEDFRMFVTPEHEGRMIDGIGEQPRSPDITTKADALGVSAAIPAIVDITADKTLGTPKKRRPSTSMDVDTPTKKKCGDFGENIEAYGAERSENLAPDFPMDSTIPPPNGLPEIPPEVEAQTVDSLAQQLRTVEIVEQIDESTRLPVDDQVVPAPPVQEQTVEVDFYPENLEPKTPGAQKKSRRRYIRQIDQITSLPNSMFGRSLLENPRLHTKEWLPPLTDRERGISAAELMSNLTTNRRSDRTDGSSRWADELRSNFLMLTEGPFFAENDESTTTEAMRLAESGMHSSSIELVKGYAQTTNLEPSMQNKTVEEAVPVDYETVAEPMIFEVPGDVPEVPIANITDEAEESGAATVTCNTNLLQSDVQKSVDANETSTSNAEDVEAFLPPKLRQNVVEIKDKQKKAPTSEAIVEICDSSTSIGSSQSERHSAWNIPELEAYLEILWHDNPIVEIEELLPPDGTNRLDAALCFSLLLQLSKDKKIVLKQNQADGTIEITKKLALAADNMDVDE